MNKILFYSGVFLLSAMVMALQIMQSRIFSVTSWYHLSFVVISLAMFGLTLGALKIYRQDEFYLRENYGLVARKHSLGFAFFIFVGLIAQIFLPLVSDDNYKTLINLPLVALATSAAYYHAGVAITVCLTRSPYPISRVYGADLLGAGLGCLAALVLMENIDTPSAIVFLSAFAFLSALCFPVAPGTPDQHVALGGKTYRLNTISMTLFSLFFVLGVINISLPRPFLYTLFFKSSAVTQKNIDFEQWNSISRVIVKPERENHRPFLWGPSPVIPAEYKATFKELLIDGDAMTPITKFDGDFQKLKYLEYDVTNIAYTLPNLKKAAIIGVGGGRDLLSAQYFGVEKIWAMDVNPIQVNLLKNDPRFTSYSNLSHLPGVEIFVHEARSWFRQNTEKLDIIQMSLIDTWASTGAGAFTLSENGLYTVEAWTIFLSDLSTNGVFTVSRWATSTHSEFSRTLSVAKATLYNLGVEDANKHIAIVHSGLISTLVVSKSPLTPEQISAIKKTAEEKKFEIVMLPGLVLPEGYLGQIAGAKDSDELVKISGEQNLDLSPSTDMRPFFFNQARILRPFDIINTALHSTVVEDVISNGQAKAILNLYIIFFFSLCMVVFVIVMPLLNVIENKGSIFIKIGSFYFVLIGLGFMLIEISFLQALGVFLGHPIYGLSVVLFSLILFAGVGSLVSEYFPLNTLFKQAVWCFSTFFYCVLLGLFMNHFFSVFAESDLLMRIFLSVCLIFPAGFLLGFGFPTGLTLAQKIDTRATAWFWGINGAAGILGSTAGVALNIALGIDKTLLIGGACYALLFICFLGFSRINKAFS